VKYRGLNTSHADDCAPFQQPQIELTLVRRVLWDEPPGLVAVTIFSCRIL
jgi:hypothetical protein